MSADFEKYRSYVDHFELTDEGKRELVNHVWNSMENAIDRAFRTDPSQMAMASGDRDVAKRALDSGPVVDLSKDEYRTLKLTKIFKTDRGGKRSAETGK